MGILWHHLTPALFQGSLGEEWSTTAVSKVPLNAFEEEEASGTAIDSLDAFTPTVVLEQASGIPTDIQATLTTTGAPEQVFTAVSPREYLL